MEKTLRLLMMAFFILLANSPVLAQQQGGPGSPSGDNPSTGTNQESTQSTVNTSDSNPQETSPATPAINALSGADVLTPRSGGGGRSYLLPSFQWTGYAITNPNLTTTDHSSLFGQSTYVGNLTLQRVRRRSQLNLDYAGGAFFYSRRLEGRSTIQSAPNGTFHSLGIRQAVGWRRWRLQLSDQLSYLPESAFGFTGFGGLNSFGSRFGGGLLASAPQLNPTFEPNQTILTGSARRLSNTAVTEIQYSPGARSSITATALYGTLHFLDPGFIDSNYWAVTAGYDHALSRRNSIGIQYQHILIRLQGNHREILNRGFQLLYGHKISGRLSLLMSGGPVASQISLPSGGAVTRSFLNTYDSFQYSLRKGSIDTSFARYTTAGSGVLAGAESDWLNMSISHSLLRKIFGSISLSHAYNQSLTQETKLQRRSKFEAWQAGLTLSREVGKHTSVYVNYYVQRQASNVCVGPDCGNVLFRQVGGVGINWHGRPIKLD